MRQINSWKTILSVGTIIPILLSLALFVLHMLTNGQYGFHRDELAVIDDARHLAWGYVAYPPITPLAGRISLELFGPSPVSVRLFAALAQSIAVLLAALMTREMDGSRLAQIVSALAVAIAPASVIYGSQLMYVTFDYLWWVLSAYLIIRLLKSENPRWWLGIGTVIGLGMMTKFTMAFFIAGIVGGVLLTQARRYLRSPWLWAGVALSVLIFLPNLIWQVQHNFISLDFLGSIHARDVEEGRAKGFLLEQLFVTASTFTIPLWLAGLYFYFFKPEGRPYRMVGWMYIITVVLFLVMQGRGYYTAPAYPMLIAAGAVMWDGWRISSTGWKARAVQATPWAALALGGVFSAVLALPIAPVNSDLWKMADQVHENYRDQVGWQELTEAVADIYMALPAEEKPLTGILVGNYGEAGALNLYGPAYGLPRAISGINSYWLRGYGDPPPQTLIILGYQSTDVNAVFESCDLAAHVTNRYNIENEETTDYPGIFVCRGLRKSWPELWKEILHFG